MKVYKKIIQPVYCACLLLAIFLMMRCTKIPPGPPPLLECTFTVNAPLTADCNIKHGTNPPPTGQRKINVLVQVEIKYMNSNGDLQTIWHSESQTNLSSFPVQLTTVKIPNDTKTPFDFEVNIIGQECTECANGYGGDNGISNCPVGIIPLSSPVLYRGARPMWRGSGSGVGYTATLISSINKRTINVDNSCGCGVSDQ